jgi:hypothetical protein
MMPGSAFTDPRVIIKKIEYGSDARIRILGSARHHKKIFFEYGSGTRIRIPESTRHHKKLIATLTSGSAFQDPCVIIEF